MITWKILEVRSANQVIESVYYKVSATDGENTVETEGNCPLVLPKEVVFSDLTEASLTRYLQSFYIQDDKNLIESRLEQQLVELAKNKSNLPPWHKPTFKVEM